jgi:hypothetical protein
LIAGSPTHFVSEHGRLGCNIPEGDTAVELADNQLISILAEAEGECRRFVRKRHCLPGNALTRFPTGRFPELAEAIVLPSGVRHRDDGALSKRKRWPSGCTHFSERCELVVGLNA